MIFLIILSSIYVTLAHEIYINHESLGIPKEYIENEFKQVKAIGEVLKEGQRSGIK